jgi:hypothetical protein
MEPVETIVILLLFILWCGCAVLINRYYGRLRNVQKRLPFEPIFSESLTSGICLEVTTVRQEVFIGYVTKIEALKSVKSHGPEVTLAVVAQRYLDRHTRERCLTSSHESQNEILLTISRDRILSVR